jgi:hypothetical protein
MVKKKNRIKGIKIGFKISTIKRTDFYFSRYERERRYEREKKRKKRNVYHHR